MVRLIDSHSAEPRENLSLDGVLFGALEQGRIGETLCLWESRSAAVVVGFSAVVAQEVHERACLSDRVPVFRRISGGGTVVVASGCLNYSLILSLDSRPELRDVQYSYGVILGRIIQAISIPGLAIHGASDLAMYGRKVSGNAQRRGRRTLLHHGTLLYALDTRHIERYVQQPTRQPEYRAGRRHSAFVTNMPCGVDRLKRSLIRAWNAAL
jgi:lipoate-protein ligase A